MIRITQVKLPLDHTYEDLKIRTAKLLRISDQQIGAVHIVKQSVDARKREEICYSYVLDVECQREEAVLRRCKNRNASIRKDRPYQFPKPGKDILNDPPVIVGSGPCGLFCALMLAQHGYRPLLLERGGSVEERTKKVEQFWKGGKLDPECNVQFGEGGAGTFSDGKLNTLVKDPVGRNREVLEIFARFGADPSICYVNKPHIGTDELSRIIPAIRREIIRLGGQVQFYSKVTDLIISEGRIAGLEINGERRIPAEAVILAIGHSARDTFSMLATAGVTLEPKPFAMGVRIEHLQAQIDSAQYGLKHPPLPPADYKLFHHLADRTVYSFCMCPGGYVVAAASGEGEIVTNGMSYSGRSGKNANAALLVSLHPKDFPYPGPLGGVQWQQELERLAFRQTGSYRAPAQTVRDFLRNVPTTSFGAVEPTYRPGVVPGNLRRILPFPVAEALAQGLPALGRKLSGFDHPDAVLTGPETRSSSPVRILRDESRQASIRGLFPAGEGAGYAGGILSAAVDGLRCAEAVIASCSQE